MKEIQSRIKKCAFFSEEFCWPPYTICVHSSLKVQVWWGLVLIFQIPTPNTIVLLICSFLSIIESFIGFGVRLISMIFSSELSVLKIKFFKIVYLFSIKLKERRLQSP